MQGAHHTTVSICVRACVSEYCVHGECVHIPLEQHVSEISYIRLSLPRLVFRRRQRLLLLLVSLFRVCAALFLRRTTQFAIVVIVVGRKMKLCSVASTHIPRHRIPIRRIMIHLCLFYHLMAKRKPLIPTVLQQTTHYYYI